MAGPVKSVNNKKKSSSSATSNQKKATSSAASNSSKKKSSSNNIGKNKAEKASRSSAAHNSTTNQNSSANKKKNPLFVARKKNFSIGHDLYPKRDLTHCVKFPRYVIEQRRMKTLKKRLREPPQIYQFSRYVDLSFRKNLAELLTKIAPESHKEKLYRLRSLAAKNAESKSNVDSKKNVSSSESKKAELLALKSKSKESSSIEPQVSFGIQEVTRHIMQKKSKLVVIAANVDPLYLILHLPSLCVKHQVPYCIVADKAWLGKTVHQRKVTCLSINRINSDAPKAQSLLSNLIKIADSDYNQKYATTITEKGPAILSKRAQHVHDKKEKLRQAEIEKSKRVVIT